MAGTALIRVAGFVVFAAGVAFCQKRAENVAFISLPDAPSVVASALAEAGRMSVEVPGTPSAVPADLGMTREAELVKIARPIPANFALVYNAEPEQKPSSDFFDKYLYPSLLQRNLNYHPSTSDGLMGRALYAASRIFVTRDETGKGRVNTPYLVGVLTSAALHMAYRPYWNRSASTPFSDFGSTIGNDAGMNLFHEFRPGLQQLMKSHAPRFVAKIEERVGR
ncbi:MAG: hypothetical protein ACYDDS_05250 [Candidatus Sulfotelmatobacter sp.]